MRPQLCRQQQHCCHGDAGDLQKRPARRKPVAVMESLGFLRSDWKSVCCFRFVEDRNTWSIHRQFLWGPALLITAALDKV